MVEEIHVFGDSHSAFFRPSTFFAGRVGLNLPLAFRIEGRSIPGGSIIGFRPVTSTKNAKETIVSALPSASRMVLAFGQVDLELGFYYRRVIKGEDPSIEGFCDLLIEVYENFIEDIVGNVDLAVKGVNLTALSPRKFAARYISRIITENNSVDVATAQRLCLKHVFGEDTQNRMHLLFNDMLRDMAKRRDVRYFDLVRETSSGGVQGLTKQKPRLAEIYKTAKFDHHLADTVAVRKMHYLAAGSVFGLC